MRRGIPGRRSRAAGWARLVGGLALPVLALGVIGTRLGIVPDVALQPVLIVGFLLGLTAFGLAIYSLADIWVSGAEGAGAAVAAIVYVLPVLAILGLVAAAAVAYPRLTDIATDVSDPPQFTSIEAPRSAPDSGHVRLQRKAYPGIVPHVYPLPLDAVYSAAREIVETRGWSITHDVPPPSQPVEGADGLPSNVVPEDDALALALASKSVMTQSRSGLATETVADTTLEAGPILGPFFPPILEPTPAPSNEAVLEAIAPTPVFGFLDDVVLRFRLSPEGTTQVDMRSASRAGEHDLGQNARRIRRFFGDLDSVLQPNPAKAGS